MKWIASLPFFSHPIKLRSTRSRELSSRLPGLGREIFQTLGLQWQKLAVLALFGMGLFLGAKTAVHAPNQWIGQLMELLRLQRLNRLEQSLVGNALAYFGSDALFLLAAFLLGLCAAGLPLVLLLPVLRGLGVGAVSGWLYLNHGMSGVGYSILVLFPATIVSMLVMLTYCKESMLMSSDMLLVATGKSERVESGIRLYCTRYLVLALVSILAAVLDSLCFRAFSRLITL